MRIVLAVLQEIRASDAPVAGLLARAPQVAAWLLVIAIGAQAALIVGDLISGPPKPQLTLDAAPPPSVPAPPLDVGQILAANLFGQPGPAAGSTDASNAPTTSMPLVLTGVVAGDDPRSGVAIIGPSVTAAKVHAIGDAMPGGARLHAVYNDRVLLDRGGTIEALMMPRQYSGPPPPAAAAPAPAGDAFSRVQRVIQQHPNLIGDIMSPQAVLAQGKLLGYRVIPGPNRQAFNSLGLRPGDLVIAINGTSLDDPTRSGEILNTLSSASDARVTVMRSGRQQDLLLNLAQVAQEAERMSSGAAGPAGPPTGVGDPATPPRQN